MLCFAGPVFGRPPAAKAKKLIAVIAGNPSAVDQVVPVVESTTQKIVRAGDEPSKSSILKLCGNYMILALIEAQAEAYTLAESAGISRQVAYDLLGGPDGVFTKLPIMSIYGKMIANHEYEPVGFTAQNGLKDANLICDAAFAGGVDMPIADLVQQRLKTQIETSGADCEWSSFAAQVKVQGGKGAGQTALGKE